MGFPFSSLLDLFRTHSTAPEPMLEQDLQRVVKSINPLLLQTTAYPKQYRKALHIAREYVDRLTQQVPGPLCLTSEQFSKNNLVRALFASPKELEEKLRLSIAMREHQPGNTDKQSLYALMGVRWERQLHFGVEEVNGETRTDVPQQTINFKDHTFTLPAASESEARQLLRDHFLQRLANQVKQHITDITQQKDALYKQAKQQESEQRNRDIPSPELAQQIHDTWEQWRDLTQQLDINHTIQHFEAVMTKPESSLCLSPFQLSMDAMGIERTEKQGGKTINLMDLHGADRRIWTVMLVQFQWQRPPSTEEQLQQAYRWLSIS
mgnify:FL=1